MSSKKQGVEGRNRVWFHSRFLPIESWAHKFIRKRVVSVPWPHTDLPQWSCQAEGQLSLGHADLRGRLRPASSSCLQLQSKRPFLVFMYLGMWLDKSVLSKLQPHAPKGTSPVWVFVGSQVPWAPEARLPWHFLEYHTFQMYIYVCLYVNMWLIISVCAVYLVYVCVTAGTLCTCDSVHTEVRGPPWEVSSLHSGS